MKIIAIIVTYNATKWIDKCFGSLVSSSLPIEIFVVDNHSDDDTVALLRKNYPKVKIHEAAENLGFGKANNLGLTMALEHEFDYVLLLNQDAWVEGNTIEKLINNYRKNEDYGVIVPLQMNGEGNLIDNLFFEYTIAINRELVTNVFKQNFDLLQEVNFANAACWLMPLSVIKNIGGFDPLFPHYGEDVDYLNRLKRHHLKVGMDISTFVFHDREYRVENKSMMAVINNCFVSELIDFKNFSQKIRSRQFILKKALIAFVKFITSGLNRYYLYKLMAYYKLFKIHKTILAHREQEDKLFHHYLLGDFK